LRDVAKRRMSPTAARNVWAQITLTPRHRHQPPRRLRLERLRGDQRLDRGDLCVEEPGVAQTRRDRLLLLDRQLKLGQPPARL
jgi:hypothetical protein